MKTHCLQCSLNCINHEFVFNLLCICLVWGTANYGIAMCSVAMRAMCGNARNCNVKCGNVRNALCFQSSRQMRHFLLVEVQRCKYKYKLE